MRPARWDAARWETVTLELVRRDGDRCWFCGLPFRGDAARHHRMRRREGGDRLANVILLHTACHQEVHAHPYDSRQGGLIVSVHDDLLQAPAEHARRGWRLLDDDGNATPCDPPEQWTITAP